MSKKAKPKKDAMGSGAEKPRMGRPPKLVDDEKTINIIRGLAQIQCTQKEAAAVLSVSDTTFETFLGTHASAREAWDYGGLNGRALDTVSEADCHSR